jgi:hypothetical protein
MARINLSPLIVDIRNKQADTVFSKWKGINYIRSRVVPSNPKTASQVAVREALARLVSLWKDKLGELKQNQDYYTRGKDKSGFNNFVGVNVVDERDGNLLDLCEDVGYSVLTTWSGAAGASGVIAVTFAPTPVPTGDVLHYLCKKVGDSEWEKDSVFTAGMTSPQNITGLTPGATYEVYGYLSISMPSDGSEVGNDKSFSQAAGS